LSGEAGRVHIAAKARTASGLLDSEVKALHSEDSDSDELCLALKKWKLQCPPSKWDLIFPQADGRPQHRKTVWRAMDRAIKKANENVKANEQLPRLTIHSLRHSGASIQLMRGTPIPEVSAMLGHANVNITLTVYTHFIPKMRTDSASTLAATIQREKSGWRASCPP
jgi:integrase